MSNRAVLWFKMLGAGAAMCIGGPALVYYISPTEEELFQKYNPELQKRSLESRLERQQDFDDFVNRLKKYSKSDKPIWAVIAEEEEKAREQKRLDKLTEQQKLAEQIEQRRKEILESSNK